MAPLLRSLPSLLLLAALGACASGPTEDEAAMIEDYLIRGSTYFQSGRYMQAYDQARRALEIDDSDARLNLLGACMMYTSIVLGGETGKPKALRKLAP